MARPGDRVKGPDSPHAASLANRRSRVKAVSLFTRRARREETLRSALRLTRTRPHARRAVDAQVRQMRRRRVHIEYPSGQTNHHPPAHAGALRDRNATRRTSAIRMRTRTQSNRARSRRRQKAASRNPLPITPETRLQAARRANVHRMKVHESREKTRKKAPEMEKQTETLHQIAAETRTRKTGSKSFLQSARLHREETS